jgi:hypothetical protein
MKCSNCKKIFEGPNHGRVVVDGRRVTSLDNCSPECRRAGISSGAGRISVGSIPTVKEIFDKTNARTGREVRKAIDNAVNGVKIPRPLSQSKIRRKMRPRETDISRAIGKQLTDAGVWNTRTQSGAIKTAGGHMINLCKPGTPDRVFNLGLNVWIEVKRPGETPTPDQVATIAKLKANGSLVFVLDDPADLDFILHELRTWKGSIETINQLIAPIQNRIDTVIKANKIARKSNGKTN